MTLLTPLWRPRALVAMAAWACLPATALAQERDSDAYRVLEEAAEKFASVESMCARFQQVTEVTLIGLTTRGHGTLCEKHPNLFSMRFADPEGDVVLVDGTYVWTYYPSMDKRQVIRFAAAGAGAGAGFNFFKAFLDEPEAKYVAVHEGTEDIDGTHTQRLGLLPRGSAAFRSATVWVATESRLLVRVRINDENGSVRTLTLSDVRLNPELSEDHFTFHPPPNARIVTR
ncbi:MAG: outer membrane lipoprotein carrier protein LolA [Gemmatimonadetes bacterium]|nr:outer membrane lipoprotein carrier protein LolA [Gemmatimonadota bacterium]